MQPNALLVKRRSQSGVCRSWGDPRRTRRHRLACLWRGGQGFDILTTYDDDEYIVRGLRAGARVYLLKDAGRKVLFEAIRAAVRGESLLPS